MSTANARFFVWMLINTKKPGKPLAGLFLLLCIKCVTSVSKYKKRKTKKQGGIFTYLKPGCLLRKGQTRPRAFFLAFWWNRSFGAWSGKCWCRCPTAQKKHAYHYRAVCLRSLDWLHSANRVKIDVGFLVLHRNMADVFVSFHIKR